MQEETRRPFAYWFFGKPGSGKGTQRRLLQQYLEARQQTVLSLEVGQLLREYTSGPERTEVTKLLAATMQRGCLVPSVYAMTVCVNRLMEQDPFPDYILLDGSGRVREEAISVLEWLEFLNVDVHVLYIDVSDRLASKRLLDRGRSDDTEDNIRTRLSSFNDSKTGTVASLSCLSMALGFRFHVIDGMGMDDSMDTVEAVHSRILSALLLPKCTDRRYVSA